MCASGCRPVLGAIPSGIALPDDARQEHVAYLAPGALTAGNYLAEFTVRDPWLPETKPELAVGQRRKRH